MNHYKKFNHSFPPTLHEYSHSVIVSDLTTHIITIIQSLHVIKIMRIMPIIIHMYPQKTTLKLPCFHWAQFQLQYVRF